VGIQAKLYKGYIIPEVVHIYLFFLTDKKNDSQGQFPEVVLHLF